MLERKINILWHSPYFFMAIWLWYLLNSILRWRNWHKVKKVKSQQWSLRFYLTYLSAKMLFFQKFITQQTFLQLMYYFINAYYKYPVVWKADLWWRMFIILITRYANAKHILFHSSVGRVTFKTCGISIQLTTEENCTLLPTENMALCSSYIT